MLAACALALCLSQVSDVPTREGEPADVRPPEERPCLDGDDAPPELRCTTPRLEPVAQPPVVPEDLPPKLVGGLSVMVGALVDGSNPISPELSFVGEVGLRWHNGIGVVGVVHGFFAGRVRNAGTVHRYGVGVGVRFGEKSHLLLAAAPSLVLRVGQELQTFGAATVLLQGVLALWKNVALVAMPAFSIGGAGVMGSLAGGVGGTF